MARIISGVSSGELRKKLLALRPFPDLPTVMSICRSDKSATKTDADLHSDPGSRVMQAKCATGESAERSICTYWGRKSHASKDNCPAKGKICHNCQRRDHFVRVGKSKQAQHPPIRGGAKPPNKVAVRELSVLDVTASAANDCKSPKVRIGLSTFPDWRSLGQDVPTPDTGADVTAMGQRQFQQLGLSTQVLNAPLAEEVSHGS